MKGAFALSGIYAGGRVDKLGDVGVRVFGGERERCVVYAELRPLYGL